MRLSRLGFEILLIGHAGHPEVEGTLGQISGSIQLIQNTEEAERVHVSDPDRVAYVTQTTLSLDDTQEMVGILRRRFPSLQSPPTDDICYATTNRQLAVKRLAQRVDLFVVIGAANSSNSNRLVEVARSQSIPAYRVASAEELDDTWFKEAQVLGISAGASVPEVLVEEVLGHLKERYGAQVEEDREGFDESVYFPLPLELREAKNAK